MFEDADESYSQEPQSVPKTGNGKSYQVDKFIIIERYCRVGENVYQNDSSEDTDEKHNLNVQTYNGLVSKPHTKALKYGHDSSREHTFSKDLKTHTIPTHAPIKAVNIQKDNGSQLEPKKEYRPQNFAQANQSKPERTSTNMNVADQKDDYKAMKYHQVPEDKNLIKMDDQRANQCLPSIKWIMGKTTEDRAPREQPHDSSRMGYQNQHNMQVHNSGWNTTQIARYGQGNMSTSPESNLHNCLFSKQQNSNFRPPNMGFPQNFNNMGNYPTPVYFTVRPLNMGGMMNGGENKLILKATHSHQVIQIPLQQGSMNGISPFGQTAAYAFPFNQFTQR